MALGMDHEPSEAATEIVPSVSSCTRSTPLSSDSESPSTDGSAMGGCAGPSSSGSGVIEYPDTGGSQATTRRISTRSLSG